MSCQDYKITIEQGATLVQDFGYSTQASDVDPVVPVDITGCSITIMVREYEPKMGEETPALLATWGTGSGTITLEPSLGVNWYRLKLSAAATAAITWSKGVGDAEITFPNGVVVRHWRLKFDVSREIIV
jgi:hypothetical protein